MEIEHSDTIKYYEKLSEYNDLCKEISYILSKRLKKDKIPFALITHRVKSPKSISEKMRRNKYQDPFNDIKDIAGVRIVYLYLSDKNKIMEAIRNEFIVKKEEDSTVGQPVNSFSYSDLKFYVKLGKQRGARYDDLKDLLCEIQVRTVMQDIWGIMSHHLLYKSVIGLPDTLKKSLNALAGSFFNIDESFERIREEKVKYQRTINMKFQLDIKKYYEQPINSETLESYLTSRFAKKIVSQDKKFLENTILEFRKSGYVTLFDIENLLNRTYDALVLFFKDKFHKDITDPTVVVLDILSWAIYFDNPRPLTGWLAFPTPEEEEKYRSLVKPRDES